MIATRKAVSLAVSSSFTGQHLREVYMSNIVEAAKSGDKRATLIALRDKIAETIQNCESSRDIASNTKRLMEVMEEIEALPDPETKTISKHDRLKKKNENR